MKKIRRIMMALLICFVIGAICPESSLQISNPVEVQAATTVATPKLVSAKPSGTTKAVIKWSAVKGVSGYRIYRSTNAKNWKTLKTISGASKVTYTDSKLKSGSRYYYTVRAYKKVKGKTVWSSYNKKGISVIAGLQYLKLNKSSISLYEGKSYTLKINGTSLKPSWKSSNTKVATVNSSGKVVAKKKGTATITATLGGRKITCKVTVKVNNYITVSETAIQLNVGESKSVKINSNYGTLWKQDINSDIAYSTWGDADDSDYLLTIYAESVGTATIRIKNAENNPTLYKDIKITVKDNSSNNKQKLKSYILNNGYMNSKGNYFIKQEKTIDGSKYSWAIIYEVSSNSFDFLLYNEDYNCSTSLNMYLPIGSSNSAKPEFLYVATDRYSYYEAYTTINTSTFTNQSEPYFTITDCSKNLVNIQSTLRSLAVNNLQMAFLGWQDLMKNKVGLTMKSIGFTAYN